MKQQQAFTTPYLQIEESVFLRNVERLTTRLDNLGTKLRPHLKTLRSVAAAQAMLPNRDAPATVSTLAEAEAFAAAGYRNLLYAVGIAPHKLARVAELRQQEVNLHIVLDSQAQAQAVAEFTEQTGHHFSVMLEIDCDDHRGGLQPNDPQLPKIVTYLQENNVDVIGVMTHSGGSYDAKSVADIRHAAAQECQAILTAAEVLRQCGVAAPITSVGSTPTAHFGEDFSDISEVRAGVFTTFDLVMKNLGVCQLEDIAMSVVTTVIGHNESKNWLFVDAGWMALSRDRGTQKQQTDYGYGLVCDVHGHSHDLIVNGVNQEHGIIHLPRHRSVSDFSIGTQLRILPNHACATAAMHQRYIVHTLSGQLAIWDRILGW